MIAIFCSKLKTFPRNIWPTYHFIVQFQIKKHFSRKQKPHTLSTSPLINERIRCKIVLRKTKSLTCVLPLFPGIAGSPFDAVLRAWTWKQTTRRIQYFHLARAQLFGPDTWLMAIMFPLFTPAQPGGERWLWSVGNSVEMAWKAKGRRYFDDKIKTKIWDDFFFSLFRVSCRKRADVCYFFIGPFFSWILSLPPRPRPRPMFDQMVFRSARKIQNIRTRCKAKGSALLISRFFAVLGSGDLCCVLGFLFCFCESAALTCGLIYEVETLRRICCSALVGGWLASLQAVIQGRIPVNLK